MAFDIEGNLYVTASLAGKRGVVRLTPGAKAELVVSGYDLVGLAFGRHGSLILATNEFAWSISPWASEGCRCEIKPDFIASWC